MSKRSSLEHFALFYEKIESSKVANDTEEDRQNHNYDKESPSLSEDDIHKLNDDVQNPIQKSPKSNPIQS